MLKRLALTMGDPGGIGAEIVVKALSSPEVRKRCSPFVVGDTEVMAGALRLLGSPSRLRTIHSPEESRVEEGVIEVLDVGGRKESRFKPPHLGKGRARKFSANGGHWASRPTAEGGALCVACIKRAVELALSGRVDGMVTAPISKEALKLAGFKWPGHTEMLAELTGAREYAMMLAGGRLKVILVTIHTALRNVPGLITRERILKTIRLAKRAADMLKIGNPRIGVAGLNPHAGEAGIFGDEEIRLIVPAIECALKEGIPVTGPYPPDTIFHKAYRGDIDIVVCMYHDQGLIPLKMIAFEKGVNVTVGLPFVRTSPDHGTAYDIAWRGVADPSSIIEAIKLAARLKG